MKPSIQRILKRAKPVEVPLEKLKLDPQNIRFSHEQRGNVSEKEMEKQMWKGADLNSLYKQIVATGRLIEEPIINSNFVVLDGNRRLVCLRKISEDIKSGELKNFDKAYLEKIHCKQLPVDTSQADIAILLAVIHVKGKLKWKTINQADHIFRLNKEHGYSYQEISETLGIGKATVTRMIKAFEETTKYGKKFSDDDHWFDKYTYFDELFKNRGLKDFASSESNVTLFEKWVHEGKLGDVRDVRKLADVLSNDRAKRVLEESNFEKAIRVLEETDPTVKSREFRQIKETTDILRGFSRQELIKAYKDPARRQILEDLKRHVSSILNEIKSLEDSK